LANRFIPVSSAAFAAVAMPFRGWLKRLFEKKTPQHAAAPAVLNREGWTLIQCDDVDSFGEWLGKDELGFPSDPNEELSLGSHLLIELYGCDGRLLEQEANVGAAMRQAAIDSEATVVAESFHEFKPYGVSGAVIIQESHYTIHTWPEHRYAAVDLFYCGGGIRVHKAVEVLRDRFQPERIKFLVVRRGLQHEVAR